MTYDCLPLNNSSLCFCKPTEEQRPNRKLWRRNYYYVTGMLLHPWNLLTSYNRGNDG